MNAVLGRETLPLSDTFRALQSIAAAWENHGNGWRLFLLESDELVVSITNFGLRMVHFWVKNHLAQPVDIIVGPETPEGFMQSTNPYFGAIIGRYANRIAGGRFSIGENTYALECNDGPNHLHGGSNGFHQQLWQCVEQSPRRLVFRLHAPAADGYPGNVDVEVVFQLEGHRLSLKYKATTDAPTILNLTHHPFFNLHGCGAENLAHHYLQLPCDAYLPLDQNMIPLGKYAAVDNCPFDFRKGALILERLGQAHEQLQTAGGFDHTFIQSHYPSAEPILLATVWSTFNGVGLRIHSTEPGVQLYTGNFMDGQNRLKNGTRDYYRSAFCLEAQHFPDSPHQPAFPSVLLQPGQVFSSETVYEYFIVNNHSESL